jgi:hypothetical protein
MTLGLRPATAVSTPPRPVAGMPPLQTGGPLHKGFRRCRRASPSVFEAWRKARAGQRGRSPGPTGIGHSFCRDQ